VSASDRKELKKETDTPSHGRIAGQAGEHLQGTKSDSRGLQNIRLWTKRRIDNGKKTL